ncbi:AI-2E family transporter [Jannaschia rubra]|uniref:Transport of quorum-sensing signal protein n=1 Tax=Jannaschia rubra TaxID=282197 RepID=A0A0M6XM92_9RHOB|nr:AI-2E family transporter [Jannaschia rubra]CTQ32048.1 Transport of quorum-sensing signal protein [Jannaschia rubra]SFG38924.1 Predicted PurR-regulated permease PerM [Jannaschia rubra]
MAPRDDPPARSAGVIDPAPPTETPKTRHPLAIPVTGLFILALVQALIVASVFLIPVTSAIFGYFILNAPRRLLERVGIPAPVSAALFTLLIGAGVFVGMMALSESIYEFVSDIPSLLREATATLTGPGGLLESMNEAREVTEEAIGSDGPGPMQVEVVDNVGLATSVAAFAPGLLSQIVFAICLMYFLVASGDLFIQKAVQSVDRFQDKKTTVATIRTIEARLGNYLGAITLINIGLGLCIGAAMFWWGLPSPWLIGIMATALNFIPFVGAVVGALIAGIIAFVTFGDPWPAIGVLLTYYGLTAFEGQFVTPTLVGQRLRLNVVMVFLSVAFFAWIWSIMGMVVAVPALIVIKVICDAIPRLHKIGLFLGDAEGFVPQAKPRA